MLSIRLLNIFAFICIYSRLFFCLLLSIVYPNSGYCLLLFRGICIHCMLLVLLRVWLFFVLHNDFCGLLLYVYCSLLDWLRFFRTYHILFFLLHRSLVGLLLIGSTWGLSIICWVFFLFNFILFSFVHLLNPSAAYWMLFSDCFL